MVVRTTTPARDVGGGAKGAMRARVLIIEGRFYEEIGDELVGGAIAALDAAGVTLDHIVVPGALEIPQVLAQAVASGLVPAGPSGGKWDGAIVLGCVIRGETAHYDIVCNNANHWMMQVAIQHAIPIGNGILTVDTEAQALARARGGINGKGGDAARACLRLIELQREFEGQTA
ncbi:MAG: 6,7-dimethyl-8-ribityllumazine synthase [Hyphomicrobium sp.]